MAKRFTATHKDISGDSFTVDIYDSSFAGVATAFTLAPGGYTLAYSGQSQERHNPFLGCQCTVVVAITDATIEALITDIAQSQEGRFVIKVTNITDSYTAFVGNALADIAVIQDMDYPYTFRLTATDGIAALKKEEYSNDGTLYEGLETYITHLARVFSKLTYVDNTFFPDGDELFRTLIDWHDVEHDDPVTATSDPFLTTWVDNKAFHKITATGERTALSCMDVLTHLLKPFGARIMQMEGIFWIEQISLRTATTYFQRKYDKTAAQISTGTGSGTNNVDRIGTHKIRGTQYEFYPPLKEVRINYDVKNRRNYFAGLEISDININGTITSPLKQNGGQSVLRITGDFVLSIEDNTYTSTNTPQIIVLFSMYLRVGSFSIVRNGTIYNFGFIPSIATWDADLPTNAVKYPFIIQAPPSGVAAMYNMPLDFTTPQMVADGDDYEFLFDIIGFYDQSGTLLDPADFTYSWSLDNLWLEVYSYGIPSLNEDEVLYVAENPTAGNTATLEIDTILGDASNPNSVGRLRVGPNVSSLVDASGWGAGSDTRDKNIADLLATVALHGQLTPTYRMLGTIYGDLRLWRRYATEGTRYWLMLGGEYSSYNKQFNGEWFELNYGAGGVSTTPVKKVKKNSDFPPVIKTPISNTIKNLPGFVINPIGSVLAPVSNNTLSANLSSGAQTSVPVETVLAANEYQTGDIVTLFDPVSGAFEDVTVTATNTGGATSITISESLTNSYPDGAYVIKKPIIGVTTLPPGTNKYTLRHNGTSWVASGLLQNDAATLGIGIAPASGKLLTVKQTTTADGISVVRSSSTVALDMYHDGSATVASTGGNNLKLMSDSGSLILLSPGGGGGQSSQVLVSPVNNVTSNLGNTGLVNVTGTYAPTTSGGDFSIYRLGTAINITGTGDQVCDGLRIVPTLTAVPAGFRGVHYVPSTNNFLHQPSGTSVVSHLIGNLGIGTGTTSPAAKLDIVGNGATSGTSALIITDSSANQHVKVRDDGVAIIRAISGVSGAPSIAFGTGAGTGPVNDLCVGSNNGFQLIFTTGTTPTNNASVFTATIGKSFPNGCTAVFSPGTNGTRAVIGGFWVSGTGNNSVTISYNNTGALAASTQYSILVILIGY